MRNILTFLLVCFTFSGLFAQTECTVKIVYSMNKSQPPSYTFKIDPVAEGARYYWSFGDKTNSDSPSPTHAFKVSDTYLVQVKVLTADGKSCYGEVKARFEGGTIATTPAVLSGRGKVKKPGATDGCRLLIYLENGTVLAPVEILPAFEFKDGQYVELAYELQKDKPSGCNTGVSAKIHKIAEIVVPTVCKVPINFKKIEGKPGSYIFSTTEQPAESKYYWYFGDGGNSESVSPTYVFKKAGTWVINLKVVDKNDKVCYGETKATFEGETVVSPTILSGKGKVKKPGSTDGCRLLITLENGTVLAPVEILPAFEFKDGQYVELAYELQKDKPSGCNTGVSAKIHKIALINVPTVCKVPINFKKIEGKPGSYMFSTTEQPAESKYYWYFGDGGMSESASPTYVYKKAGTWVINLKVVDKAGKVCYGEMKATFEGETNPPLTARGKVKNLAVTGCDLVIALDNGILIPAKIPADFLLREGQYVEFTYEKYAEKVTNCKEGTDVKILTIKEIQTAPECRAYFTATNKIWSDPAMMKKVAFTNLSVGDIKELTWNFGDNTTLSNEPKPIHEYKDFGTYKVCLSILTKAGCKSEYCAEVKVENLLPTCKFDIVVKPKEASPKSFLFYTVSQAEIKSWKWKFGDGQGSELKNPEHTYEKTGTYEVSCTITTAAGCTETRVIKQTVLPAPLATCKGAISLILFDPTEKCNGKATVKLLNENAKEISGVKYVWTDGRTGSTVENLCPDRPYSVQAIIEGVCQKNTSFTMLSKPVWGVTTANGQSKFSVISPKEGIAYEWDFGNGMFLKGAEINYNFENDGLYNVTLKAVSGGDFTEYAQQVEVLKSVTSISNIKNPELEVYPNPVKDILKINFGHPVEGTIDIEIMNIAGQIAYSQQLITDGFSQTAINVQHLKPGIYFLRVINGSFPFTGRKFIKAE